MQRGTPPAKDVYICDAPLREISLLRDPFLLHWRGILVLIGGRRDAAVPGTARMGRMVIL